MEQNHNTKKPEKGKKSNIATIIFVIAIIAGGSFLIIMAITALNQPANLPIQNSATTLPSVTSPETVYGNNIQNVQLSMQNYNYYPQRIVVKKGIPVRITADLNSIRGCYRSFLIPDLGVRGAFTSSTPYIDFTPTKAGEFRFSCSMGMGTGTIVVEE